MSRFSNPFSLQGAARASARLADRFPGAYLGLALSFTALGYAALALFPLLTLIGLLSVVGGVGSADSWQAWLDVLFWLVVGAASGVLSFQLFTLRVPVPSGLGIKHDKAPKLYELIDELSDVYSAPLFERVVVHDEFELTVVPVPRFGIPVVRNYVLRIGLPVLQALSPDQFRACLARRLGQYSGVHNRLTHIVYRWRQYCEQYRAIYLKQKAPLALPFQWFFRLYVPVLDALCVHALHQDELEADRYALEVTDDDKLADMIKRVEVSHAFLKAKYWPKIFQMLQKQGTALEHLPHASMAKVLRNGLTPEEVNDLLEKLRDQPEAYDRVTPSYSQRMENIGHFKDAPPLPVVETAAQRYLGKMSAAIISMLDKMWLKKHAGGKPVAAQGKKKPPESASENPHQRLSELQARIDQGEDSDELLWELADATEKVEGKAAAIAIYQRLLKRNPTHAKTIFAVGRILLSQNDPAGVDVLEKAIKLNSACRPQAYWLLANYFKKTNQPDKAKHYLGKANSLGNATAA